MSTVYDLLGPNSQQPPIQNVQNRRTMLPQLMDFMQTFNGNPEQIVRNLIATGKMSQQQFEQLSQQASDIQRTFNIR